MKHILVFLIALVGIATLKVGSEVHELSLAMSTLGQFHQLQDGELHLMPLGNSKVTFNYKRAVDPNSYRLRPGKRPKIMDFLPLTEDDGKKMVPLESNGEKVRSSFLSAVEYNKTVDMGQARKLAQLFTTDMGKAILTYFQGLTTSGLNFYNLSPRNYRLWLAIKILAGKEIKKYSRSMVEDMELFNEFYRKAWEKKNGEIMGISRPTALGLVKLYHKELLTENKHQINKPKSLQKNNTSNKSTERKLNQSSPVDPHPSLKKDKEASSKTTPQNFKKTSAVPPPHAQSPKISPVSSPSAKPPKASTVFSAIPHSSTLPPVISKKRASSQSVPHGGYHY